MVLSFDSNFNCFIIPLILFSRELFVKIAPLGFDVVPDVNTIKASLLFNLNLFFFNL